MTDLLPQATSASKPGQTQPGAAGRMTGGNLVSIQSSTTTVRAYLGEEGARVSGGYGEWDVTERPRDVSMTTWRGRAPFEMELPILLDRFATGDSVEEECRRLERLALPVSSRRSPPTIRLFGAVPRAEQRWVVQSIDWGDQVRALGSGSRMRQYATLHLLEFQPPELVAPRAKATPQNARRYRARKGDTLRKLAKKFLGNANHWKQIRRLNPKYRSPTKKIPKNSVLLIPKK